MLFGMLGGALSTLVSLYMTGKKLTNTVWFDPRLMTTTRLDVRQWLIWTAAALSIIAAAEIRKATRRRTAAT